MLRRHKWFIVEAVVLVGLVAGIVSSLRTPLYQATARVLLRPNDPTEQLNPENSGQNIYSDPDRYVAGQQNIVESEGVAREAAKALPALTVEEIEAKTSVAQDGKSNVLKISAIDPEPAQAREVANALAKGYIENRRQAAVAGLEQAAKDIEERLTPLQNTIAQLDARIGEGSTVPGSSSQLVTPAAPGSATAPARPAGQVDGLAGAGGPATTAEALKAARYAAAVQYETLFARQQELLVNISLKRGEAELIQEARVPIEAISPKPVRDGLLGVFVGLLLGVGITVLREQLNDRLRSVDEVEQISGLPLLARLPHDDETAKGNGGVVVLDRPNSPLAEAVRSLRTSIQYLGVDQPIKLIVVTSSVPGEGKSLVAANLAAMFAQADYRTLLVSADLRRSSIDELFGKHPPSQGLTGLIAPVKRGSAPATGNGNGRTAGHVANEAARAVVKTPVNNLLLLPSGPTPPNPAELLGSRRMSALLVDWAATADIVILDTPPLLAVTDAAVLAARSDGVVLVAAVNETGREQLKHSVDVLQGTGARLLGVVANKVPMSGRGAYYYSSYYGAGEQERKGGTRRLRSGLTRSG
jgi:Mrp family chromosome partitioning ATPase/capsular polysaccharide biosynthesis protein